MQKLVAGAMEERGLRVQELAAIVGIRQQALVARIQGRRRWTAGGLLNVADALGLDAVQTFRRCASGSHLTYPLLDGGAERVG